jgi:Major Facilitator Superfamily
MATVTATVPTDLEASTRLRIFAYVGFLFLILNFGAPFGGLIRLPVTFLLKNKLHLTAQQSAIFNLIDGVPLYLAFAFGFARDTFSPFGRGDRGYLVLFGGMTAATFVAFALAPTSYGSLLAGMLLATAAYLFVRSAVFGLSADLAQQHLMTGRISALRTVISTAAGLAAFVVGGVLSQALEGGGAGQAARVIFLVGAAVMAVMAVFGLWRPASVYENLRPGRPAGASRWAEVKRLGRHWPIYPALAIELLWQFGPGGETPLKYFMQNTLHATDAEVGLRDALFEAGFIPVYLLYGWLCRRLRLRTILFWSTLVAVPQYVPLAFVHSTHGALVAAVLMGLMGGVCSAAFIDLLIRSSPPGLQGTVMMLSVTIYYLDSRFGDVLGSWLYDRFHDFNVCVIAITVTYALIVPVLWLVPRRLTATADGQAVT